MDESSLIRQAQKGDVRAFNVLVRAHQTTVYNVAYRVLGDSDSAADVAQETFVHAYKALADFKGGSFRAWLVRIATNACYDQLRYDKRRPATSLEEMAPESETGDPGPPLPDPGEGPEEYVLRQELGHVVARGLETLPAEQRVTLVLSDIQGFSYEEIANATGVELGTVKSRLSRARARMRDFLLSQQELLPATYRLGS
ncbi:MAG: sigma-70 family RNA polymerase sigma factor [Anaerolineae bacterium]